jgi:hypothetical protein
MAHLKKMELKLKNWLHFKLRIIYLD